VNLSQFRTDHVVGPFRWPPEIDPLKWVARDHGPEYRIQDHSSRVSTRRVLGFLSESLITANVISINLNVDAGGVRKALRRLEAKKLARREVKFGKHYWCKAA
jgi:hypothetical protein